MGTAQRNKDVDLNSATMACQTKATDYKHRLAASFDSRVNYDDDYTVNRATQLVELAHLKNGDSVLDLATGTGIVAVLAARAVGAKGNVIGVDISRGMLDQARKKIRAEGLHQIELIEADVEKLNFGAESFDAILCSSALMWLTDIPATLRNCRTWLKTRWSPCIFLLLRIVFHDSSFGQGLRQVWCCST